MLRLCLMFFLVLFAEQVMYVVEQWWKLYLKTESSTILMFTIVKYSVKKDNYKIAMAHEMHELST